MSHPRRRFSSALHADVLALCLEMCALVAKRGEPTLDIAGTIDRHGLDALADCLTDLVWNGLAAVADLRGNTTPDAILDEHLHGSLFSRQTDELRDLIRSQVLKRCHPSLLDRAEQDDFVSGLLALHVRAVIEAAAPGPHRGLSPIRAALEHRPRISGPDQGAPGTRQQEVFDHVCTSECVPYHEHPWLGCRGLQLEIITRRRRRRG